MGYTFKLQAPQIAVATPCPCMLGAYTDLQPQVHDKMSEVADGWLMGRQQCVSKDQRCIKTGQVLFFVIQMDIWFKIHFLYL